MIADMASATRGTSTEDGPCVHRPIPELSVTNFPVFDLFERTSPLLRFSDMNGYPLARDLLGVESLARGLGIVWDLTTISAFQEIENIQLTHLREEWSKRQPQK